MVCLSSCNRGPKLIPAETLSEIFARMYVEDQWIQKNPSVRRQADTSLVYDPLFEEFGYTFEDYNYTVDRYLLRPDRFEKVFQKTQEMLSRRYDELNAMKDIEQKNKELMRKLSGFYDNKDFWPFEPDSLNYDIHAKGRDSIRTDKEPETRAIVRYQPSSDEGQVL